MPVRPCWISCFEQLLTPIFRLARLLKNKWRIDSLEDRKSRRKGFEEEILRNRLHWARGVFNRLQTLPIDTMVKIGPCDPEVSQVANNVKKEASVDIDAMSREGSLYKRENTIQKHRSSAILAGFRRPWPRPAASLFRPPPC